MINIEKISDKEKLEYLNTLLEEDMEFKLKFIKYFEFQKNIEKCSKNKNLENLTKEFYELFNDADLGVDLEDLQYNYDYYYEDDVQGDFVEDLFSEIQKKFNIYMQKDDFYEAIFMLFTIQKAIDLSPSVEDEYELIWDYEEGLFDYLFTLLNAYEKKLKKSEVSFENRKKIISFLIDNSQKPEELKNFNEIFETLINSKELALFCSENIKKFHTYIQLFILNALEDDEKYINTAKKLYKEDDFIAKKLLEKLDELSKYKEYEDLAKECFSKNQNYFCDEIFKVISYKKSKSFYLELLKYKVLNSHKDIEYYILYTKYVDENEKGNIQDEIFNNCNKTYYINILEYEKEYERILALAKNSKHFGYINLQTLLKPIRFHFPKECLEIVIKECNSELNENKNRGTYRSICNLLIFLKEVPILKDEINLYIQSNLVKRRPALPALKDELSKAALI